MGESLQRDLKDRGVWVVAFLQRGVLVACVSLQRGHARDLFFGHDVRVYDVMNGNFNQIYKSSVAFLLPQDQEVGEAAFLRLALSVPAHP
jgi:hypothetical protein